MENINRNNNGMLSDEQTLPTLDVDSLIAWESGELTEAETVAMFQKMIDDGSVWRLQGSFGRTAMDLIRQGYCQLGQKSYRDYWGNHVPSCHEIQPGYPGSAEFVKQSECYRDSEN